MNLSATEVHPRKSTGWSLAPASILRNRLFFSPRSPQTPSLPDADPRSGRPRSAGRKSKFLAVTDTPLQALILLNGTQYVEAARVLGEKLHREAKGDVAAMIEQGFLRCLSRKPDERERVILQQLYTEQLAHFSSQPDDAANLLKIGAAKRDAAIPAPAAAAATVLAQALMNHDASIVKR